MSQLSLILYIIFHGYVKWEKNQAIVFPSYLLDVSCTCMNCKYGHLQIYISCRSLQIKGVHNILKSQCKHFSRFFFSYWRTYQKGSYMAVHCCKIGPKFIFLLCTLEILFLQHCYDAISFTPQLEWVKKYIYFNHKE